MTYQPILQVRDPDGNLIDILTIRGKSAWDLAKEAGYSGTAQNLSEALSLISGGFYWEWQNGTNLGPSAVLHFGENSYNIGAIPMATQTQSGIITTTSQNWSGNKSLQGNFYPLTTDTYDLGSLTNKWKNIHISQSVYSYGNDQGFIVKGEDFTDPDDSSKTVYNQISFYLGGGRNRGIFDSGTGGLPKEINTTSGQWLLYWNENNNAVIQLANTLSLRTMASKTFTLNFYTKYLNSSSKYTDSPRAFIKVHSKSGYGSDLILSSGNATVISSGDSADSFYTDFLESDKTYSGTEHLFLVSDSNFIFYSYGGDRIISHTTDAIYLGDTDHRWKGIYSNSLSNEGSLNTKNLFVQNPSLISGAGVTGHFHPSVNNSHYLGNSAYRWQYLYVNNINVTGTITSTNNITSTGTITSTGNFVTTANNRGFKVFNNNKTYSLKLHMGNGGENRGLYDGEDASGGLSDWALHWNKSNNALINANDRFIPDKAGEIYLGDSDHRWKNIYTLNLNNNGSDIRNKIVQDDIILKKLLLVYDSVVPIAYKWKNNELGNSTHDRVHIGLSAQEVEEKMCENELTRMDFGGLCVDPVYETDENGDKTDKIIDEQYSLRYGEFHGLHILKNHQQDSRITMLEEKNQQLENTILELKTQIELLKLAIGG